MPAVEANFRVSDAVLWMAVGIDRHGQPTVTDPVQIRVRWDESAQDPNAPQDELTSRPVQLVVDRDLTIGSILRFGTLAEVPETPDNLFRVTNYSATVDLKGRHYFRKATLARHGSDLPTIEAV